MLLFVLVWETSDALASLGESFAGSLRGAKVLISSGGKLTMSRQLRQIRRLLSQTFWLDPEDTDAPPWKIIDRN